MKEILITSSALILALLALRTVFRRSISRRAQYALWGLVALRLLLPVSLPAADFSVLTAAAPAGQQLAQQLENRAVYVLPVDRRPISEFPDAYGQAPGTPVSTAESFGYQVVSGNGVTVTKYAEKLTLGETLALVWKSGMAVMAVWLLTVNLRFWRKLRRARKPYAVENCQYPVYLVETGLPSPCLFGLLRPAVYLTPAAVDIPESLRHVLAHETTHARHLDPLWSLVRCVCLTVYWFHPLVWAAAIVSQTDCELACDEGALTRLAGNERIPYGQTLLRLIPVRTKPGNPLLSATTMTAGKRQLRDRITRIAENRRTVSAALFAVLAVAALVCAVTFTGGKAAGVPLTAEELAYFNEDYFNTVGKNIGRETNLRNQFLSSLYDTPQGINLFELFYCGIPAQEQSGLAGDPIPDTAWDEVINEAYGGEDPDCPSYGLSVSAMDGILQRYMGLTVAETDGVGLDSFDLFRYNNYFWSHGDTNYRWQVIFTAGERQGNTVRLMYDDHFMDEGVKMLTLETQPDGSYHFVSNVRLPSRPAYDPEVSIDLSDAPGYEPTAAVTTDVTASAMAAIASSHFPGPILSRTEVNGVTALCWQDGDVIRFAYRSAEEAAPFLQFLTAPNDGYAWSSAVHPYTDLLGHDGFYCRYHPAAGEEDRVIYYYVDGDGALRQLAAPGDIAWEADLDGDGTKELLWCGLAGDDGTYLTFQTDGQLRQANLAALLREHYPQLDDVLLYCWGAGPDHITVEGGVPLTGKTDGVTAFSRSLYFNGKTADIYRMDLAYTDHVSDAVNVPDAVLAAAKAAVLEHLNWWQSHTGVTQTAPDGTQYQGGTQAQWDDWRITACFAAPLPTFAKDLALEVYTLSYELHTTTPEKVEAAGGMGVQDTGWVSGFYDEAPFLMFRTENGQRTLLPNSIPGDVGTGTFGFYGEVARSAVENGLITLPEVDGDLLCGLLYENPTALLAMAGNCAAAEQETLFRKMLSCAAEDETAAYYISSRLDDFHWNDSGYSEPQVAAMKRLAEIAATEHFVSTSARRAQEVADAIIGGGMATLTYTPADGVGGGTYTADMEGFNEAYSLKTLAQDFRWHDLHDSDTPPGQRNALTIASGDGSASLTCWPGTAEVCFAQEGQLFWLQAESVYETDAVWDGTVFSLFRGWYDEVELAWARGDIVIPDAGQSHEAIAQAWVDAEENATLRLTPGSKFANTYVRNIVSLDWDLPETAYPENTAGRERFYFSYDRIFVPENETALHNQMAGNTGSYDGRYGEAPAGAMENFQIGPMYLAEDGWRCDGTGTGP